MSYCIAAVSYRTECSTLGLLVCIGPTGVLLQISVPTTSRATDGSVVRTTSTCPVTVGQLADTPTRGLPARGLDICGCHLRLCVLSFRFFGHSRDRELSMSASCPVKPTTVSVENRSQPCNHDDRSEQCWTTYRMRNFRVYRPHYRLKTYVEQR